MTPRRGALDEGTENAALREALAAEHAAVWGYGVVGAALAVEARPPATAAETAHRDVRDQVVGAARGACRRAGRRRRRLRLPFPVLSGVDAAALAVVLEDGVAAAWVRVLDQAAQREVRELAVGWLGAAEARAVAWRAPPAAPVTSAFPGLPEA